MTGSIDRPGARRVHGTRRVGRRIFLTDLGRGSVAAAVFGVGLVACASGDDGDGGDAVAASATASRTSAPPAPTPAAAAATATATSPAAPATISPTPTAPAAAVSPGGLPGGWRRVLLGSVSAYVIVRGGEAAVVDTGVAGSADEIEAGLAALGAAWDAVGHVILTHSHPDHQGSLPAVLAAAGAAAAYAGAGDIPAITSPRTLIAVADGDHVFDLEIIETPGHTPGHISVLDRAAGLLVAGDALNGADGGVVGPNPRFTSDMATANASAVKLGTYAYDAVVFGHGDPVVGGASRAVADMAAALSRGPHGEPGDELNVRRVSSG